MSDFDAAKKRLERSASGARTDGIYDPVTVDYRLDLRLLLDEVERLKAENVTLLADVDDLTTVKRLRSELAAERAQRERLEKALRSLLLSADAFWEEANAGHDWPQYAQAAREALRPAAPECHCTGDGHKPDCAFWVSLSAPEPTPSEEKKWPGARHPDPTAQHTFVRSTRGPWCGRLADDGHGHCGLSKQAHPTPSGVAQTSPSSVGVPAAGSEQPVNPPGRFRLLGDARSRAEEPKP